MDFLVIIDLNT